MLPKIACIISVLPAPISPDTPKTSPARTSKDTFSNAPGQFKFLTSNAKSPIFASLNGYLSPISLPIINLTMSFISISAILLVSI